MNCKQLRRFLQKGDPYPSMTNLLKCEVEAHLQFCESCRQEMVLSRLMDTLIGCYGEPITEESPWDEMRLTNRIKSRIHEISERSNSSWEAAIISVRGWLLAFGAAAVLLLILSNQLPASNITDPSDPTERDQASLSSPLMSEEIISSTSLSTGLFGEELEHGQ